MRCSLLRSGFEVPFRQPAPSGRAGRLAPLRPFERSSTAGEQDTREGAYTRILSRRGSAFPPNATPPGAPTFDRADPKSKPSAVSAVSVCAPVLRSRDPELESTGLFGCVALAMPFGLWAIRERSSLASVDTGGATDSPGANLSSPRTLIARHLARARRLVDRRVIVVRCRRRGRCGVGCVTTWIVPHAVCVVEGRPLQCVAVALLFGIVSDAEMPSSGASASCCRRSSFHPRLLERSLGCRSPVTVIEPPGARRRDTLQSGVIHCVLERSRADLATNPAHTPTVVYASGALMPTRTTTNRHVEEHRYHGGLQ